MKIIIEPSGEFFMAGEVMVRMWTGLTEEGSAVVALVTAVAFPGQAAAMAEGLVSIPPPTPEAAKRWAAHILAGGGDDG